MRGIPNPRKGSGKLAWRSRQKRGAIMRPETFQNIVKTARGKGGVKLSLERRKKIAGKAYQRTLQAKYNRKLGR